MIAIMSVLGTDVGSDVSETSTPSSFVPLSFDDGDVILRAGSHSFKVHVTLLRLASPVFSSMFSLPQPPIENDSKPPVPTIEMDDDP
jgi:BTB/POZ domain